MKIYLDLLPTQRKIELKKRKRFFLILKQEVFFLFPIFIFFVILLNIFFVLKIQKNETDLLNSQQQSQKQYQQLNFYEEKFAKMNDQIGLVSKIQTKHIYWSRIFDIIDEMANENVYFSDISTKDFHLYFAGRAKTREDLMSLKNKFENQGCFENINVPLSNLVNKENADFQMDLSVKEECLRQINR